MEAELPVFDLYSYRRRLAENDEPEVFAYDRLPDRLLVQVIHIWRDAIGPYNASDPHGMTAYAANNSGWQQIESFVAREHGLFRLGEGHELSAFERCTYSLRDPASFDLAIDLIEFSFLYIDQIIRHFDGHEQQECGIAVSADDAIAELNERFRRAGVGYRFECGKIIRIDSELIHAEVVKPALRFLQHKGFEGPRDEFLQAFDHFRAREHRDAITDANNAFESTLKAICAKRRWQFDSNARASDLLKAVRDNGLFPTYLDNSFDQLIATLKSGLPEVRNNEGSHGQGAEMTETPAYVAAYAIHLAATNILFLAEAHKALGN